MAATPLIITPRIVRRPDAGTLGVLARHPFVAIDVETTGTSAHARVVEVGAVKLNHRGEVLDRYGSICNPGADVPLNPAAQRVHGITRSQIWTAPPTAEVLAEFAEFIGGCGVVAHNLSFENRLLTAEYARLDTPPPNWQGICTLSAARKTITAPQYKLGFLLELLGIDAINDHRAVSDAEACGKLLATLIDKRGVSDLEPLAAPKPALAQARRRAPAADSAPSVRVAGPAREMEVPEDLAHLDQPVRRGPTVSAADARRAAMGGFAPTPEQGAILDAFQSGGDLVVSALAGTGKTSVLLGASQLEAQRNPRRRGFYLAFNRSVADSARAEFPSQVQASTAHSLALKNLRHTAYGPLLAKLDGGRSTFRELAEAIGSREIRFPRREVGPTKMAQYPVTRLALATVDKFCRTMDTEIGPRHVPEQKGFESWMPQREELVHHVLPFARRAWAAIQDPHNWAVQFTPDHYLKLWADTHPVVGDPGGYLLLDEAQDANPLISSIVADQSHLQIIRVGDQNQAIYGFTGAVDAMRNVPGAQRLSLTKSWRFGPAVADSGNYYLAQLRSPLQIVGDDRRNSRLISPADPVDAVLCRTNAAAIAELIAAQAAGKKTALIGDTEAGRRFCASAEELKSGRSPRDADLAAFTTWGELQEYVEHSPAAGELKTLVELVDEHGEAKLQAALDATVAPNRAELISATAHKVKGLEFGKVRINSDWTIDAAGYQEQSDLTGLQDEQMLAYVALTRAQDHLDPGQLLNHRTIDAINARHGHHASSAGLTAPTEGQLL